MKFYYYRHDLPYTDLKELAESKRVVSSDKARAFADEYYEVLLEKLQYTLSNREGLDYSEHTKEYMYNMLRMYIDMKYVDTEKQAEMTSSKILDEWFKHFKPELIGVILEDLINHPNEATEKYIMSRRDEIISQTNRRVIKCISENDDASIKDTHKIMCTEVFNERDIIKEQVYFATMQKYGIDRETAMAIYNKAFAMYSKVRFPVNIFLDLAYNLENLMYSAEYDDVLTKDVIIDNIMKGVEPGRKTLLVQNPRVLNTRINFFNWYNFECRDKGVFEGREKIQDPTRFVNTLMWERTGLYEFYDYEISKAMDYLSYPHVEDESGTTKPVNYSSLMELYLNAKKHNGNEKEEKDIEKMEFIQSMLNIEFGEPLKADLAFMDKCYEMAKDYDFEEIKNEVPDDFQPVIEDIPTKSGRRKVFIRLAGHADEKESEREEHKVPKVVDAVPEELIDKYIEKLSDLGIECEVEVESERISNGQHVRYFVFKVGDYRICETIGQSNNRTYILKSKASIEEFEEELARRDTNFSSIAKTGEALGINHIGGSSEDYILDPNRILILFEMVGSCDVNSPDILELRYFLQSLASPEDSITLDELQKMNTKEVDISEIPEVAGYVGNILKLQQKNTEDQRSIIEALNDHMEKTIEENKDTIGLSSTQVKSAKERVVSLKDFDTESNKDI